MATEPLRNGRATSLRGRTRGLNTAVQYDQAAAPIASGGRAGRRVGVHRGALVLVSEGRGDEVACHAALGRQRRQEAAHRVRGDARNLGGVADAVHLVDHPVAAVRLVRGSLVRALALEQVPLARLASGDNGPFQRDLTSPPTAACPGGGRR